MIAINVPANKAWSLLPQDDPESYRPDDLIELGGRRFWESLADSTTPWPTTACSAAFTVARASTGSNPSAQASWDSRRSNP